MGNICSSVSNHNNVIQQPSSPEIETVNNATDKISDTNVELGGLKNKKNKLSSSFAEITSIISKLSNCPSQGETEAEEKKKKNVENETIPSLAQQANLSELKEMSISEINDYSDESKIKYNFDSRTTGRPQIDEYYSMGNSFLMAYTMFTLTTPDYRPFVKNNKDDKKYMFTFYENNKETQFEIDEDKLPVKVEQEYQLELQCSHTVSQNTVDLSIPLLEKALKKFFAKHYKLEFDKFSVHKILTTFQKCIYDVYDLFDVTFISAESSKQASSKIQHLKQVYGDNEKLNLDEMKNSVPTVKQLFNIIQIALSKRFLIRCFNLENQEEWTLGNEYFLVNDEEKQKQGLFKVAYFECEKKSKDVGKQKIIKHEKLISGDELLRKFDYLVFYNFNIDENKGAREISSEKDKDKNVKEIIKIFSIIDHKWEDHSFKNTTKLLNEQNKISNYFTIECKNDKKVVLSLFIPNALDMMDDDLTSMIGIQIYQFNKKNKQWNIYKGRYSRTNEMQLVVNLDEGHYIIYPYFPTKFEKEIEYYFNVYIKESSKSVIFNKAIEMKSIEATLKSIDKQQKKSHFSELWRERSEKYPFSNFIINN